MRGKSYGALAGIIAVVVSSASFADSTVTKQLPPNVGTGYSGTVGTVGTTAPHPATGQTTGQGKGAKSSGGNTPYVGTQDPRAYGGSNETKNQQNQYWNSVRSPDDDKNQNCRNCAR